MGPSLSMRPPTGTPASTSSCRSMSMRLYLRKGAPDGVTPCVASQPRTSGMRSAISAIVCTVTSRLIATYGCSSQLTMLGSLGMCLLLGVGTRMPRAFGPTSCHPTVPGQPGRSPIPVVVPAIGWVHCRSSPGHQSLELSGCSAAWQRATFGTWRPRVQIPASRPLRPSRASPAGVVALRRWRFVDKELFHVKQRNSAAPDRGPGPGPSGQVRGLTLADLQASIEATFRERARARGVDGTFRWWVEEVGEVAKALRRRDPAELEHELGDA